MSVLTNLKSHKDIRLNLAKRFQQHRVNQNMTQEELAERSGVSLGSLRRFESQGEISLKHLVNVAITLRLAADFDDLFKVNPTIDLFSKQNKPRKRARSLR